MGNRKELITEQKDRLKMLVQQDWLALYAKLVASSCKKASVEISACQDIVVDILLKNILVQRGSVSHEQR